MTFEYFREGAPHPLVRESSFNVSRRNIRKYRIVEAHPTLKIPNSYKGQGAYWRRAL